jgi:hypothetical protein
MNLVFRAFGARRVKQHLVALTASTDQRRADGAIGALGWVGRVYGRSDTRASLRFGDDRAHVKGLCAVDRLPTRIVPFVGCDCVVSAAHEGCRAVLATNCPC